MGSGEVVSYAQLEERSLRLARAFREAGLNVGDHVALVVENQARTHEMLWGAHRAGLYYTPINTRLTAEEAAFIVREVRASAVLASGACADLASGMVPLMPEVLVRWAAGGAVPGYEDYEHVIAAHAPERLDDEQEGMAMTYSSGTTGRPKGVKRSMSGAPLGQHRHVYDIVTPFSIDEDAVFICSAPIHHAGPLAWTMSLHRIGATCVLMERFDAKECLRLIQEHRVTHGWFVPTMFLRMLKLSEGDRLSYDVSSLQRVVHAAAPCPVPVKEQMLDWWGPIIDELYSGSEGGGMTYVTADEWRSHPGTVGRSTMGELHICDDDGNELPPGQVGVIWWSEAVAIDYLGDPAKSRSVTNDKGWVTLWDIGYLDEDGWLYLTDRKQFMIVSGGVNIYPQEIEDVLSLHPDVADTAVIGVPNQEFGEEVKAIVQLVDPTLATPDLAADLVAWCRERLAHYKCPRSVDFETSLPRSDNGKLYKQPLRERYWVGHSSRIL